MKIWQRIGGLSAVVALSFMAFIPTSSAGMSPEIMSDPGNPLLFGQRHAYSVTLRGNGEAIVYARLVLTNPDETQLTATSFTIPGTVSDLAIYQQKLAPVCAEYNYELKEQPCLKYQDPDYASPYYYGTASEYKKLTPSQAGDVTSMDLAFPIDSTKTGALIIGYSSKSYVSERVGLFSFAFPTIKVPQRVEATTVSIDVDADLRLKSGKSTIDYTGTASPVDAVGGTSSGLLLDRVASTIGSTGGLIKTSKNLAAGESYTVRGDYAASWTRLYLMGIIWTILIVVLLGWLAVWLSRRMWGATTLAKTAAASTSHEGSPLGHELFFSPITLGMGFVSALLVLILSLIIHSITQSGLLNQVFGYDSVMVLLSTIIFFLLYVLAIFGPATLVATKHGVRSLIAVMICELIWFAVFFVLYLALFSSGLNLGAGFRDAMPSPTSMPYYGAQ